MGRILSEDENKTFTKSMSGRSMCWTKSSSRKRTLRRLSREVQVWVLKTPKLVLFVKKLVKKNMQKTEIRSELYLVSKN